MENIFYSLQNVGKAANFAYKLVVICDGEYFTQLENPRVIT